MLIGTLMYSLYLHLFQHTNTQIPTPDYNETKINQMLILGDVEFWRKSLHLIFLLIYIGFLTKFEEKTDFFGGAKPRFSIGIYVHFLISYLIDEMLFTYTHIPIYGATLKSLHSLHLYTSSVISVDLYGFFEVYSLMYSLS